MKITICGSIAFTHEIKKTTDTLLKQGHQVEIPFMTKKILDGEISLEDFLKIKEEKGDIDFRTSAEEDLIKRYFRLIKESDAILVLNYDKNGIKNYIGGNTLIEMAFAHVLDRQIFLLNPMPDMQYKDEIEAMKPTVINGNLNLIMEEKFLKIKEIAEKETDCSAHKFDHSLRVYNICLKLAEGENIDFEVLKAAALLHDIGGVKELEDATGNSDHATIGAQMSLPILMNLGFSDEKIKHIQDCIISHRYKTDNKPKTREAQILFDADKLESTGAVGIARSFAWVGRNNANIYKKADVSEYADENLGGKINGRIQNKTKHSPQIEFETKLKSLPDKLYTEKAKEICRERTEYYKTFLDRLEKEIIGEI